MIRGKLHLQPQGNRLIGSSTWMLALGLAGIFLLPEAFLGQKSHSSFFPSDFDEGFYVEHLNAMQELPLYGRKSEVGFEACRFLWIRSFHDPIAVSISKTNDDPQLRFVRLKRVYSNQITGSQLRISEERLIH